MKFCIFYITTLALLSAAYKAIAAMIPMVGLVFSYTAQFFLIGQISALIAWYFLDKTERK